MWHRLTLLTGLSLLFMAAGLYLAVTGATGSVSARYFFITIGILGWFVGNRLVELDERIASLEVAAGASAVEPSSAVEPAPIPPAGPA